MGAETDAKRLRELTVGDAKRFAVYAAAALLAVALFAALVWQVAVALLLGVVAGAFLLPVQEWLEGRLRARAGSALVTISLIVVPLLATGGYAWSEMSRYSTDVREKREQIIADVSRSLSDYVAVENTRATLEAATTEALVRSGRAVEELREKSALLLVSATIFFFTLYYVLTQRVRLVAYIKLRVPGEFLPLYEKLAADVGGALRGALLAVMIDQSVKGVVILVLNLVFGVPLAVVLALVTFLIGFFPLLGEWAVYIPISVYLLVFRDDPTAAAVYLSIGVALTLTSSLVLRPKLAAAGAGRFNFYWMLVALVSGVFTFGVPGVVLGPAILGFAKAVLDSLVGDVRYETSLLKEELRQEQEEGREEQGEAGEDGGSAGGGR
jgi:predicted PurR-regulated permease PerM